MDCFESDAGKAQIQQFIQCKIGQILIDVIVFRNGRGLFIEFIQSTSLFVGIPDIF